MASIPLNDARLGWSDPWVCKGGDPLATGQGGARCRAATAITGRRSGLPLYLAILPQPALVPAGDYRPLRFPLKYGDVS